MLSFREMAVFIMVAGICVQQTAFSISARHQRKRGEAGDRQQKVTAYGFPTTLLLFPFPAPQAGIPVNVPPGTEGNYRKAGRGAGPTTVAPGHGALGGLTKHDHGVGLDK